MSDLPRVPYHIGEQSATVLLAPAQASLDEIETRLRHYVERLRMPDADRQTLAEASEVLGRARSELARLRGGRP